MTNPPQLWIVAGANGSGKTTLVKKYKKYFSTQLPVINPDDIADVLEPNNTIHHSEVVKLQAGKQAINLQNECLHNKESFIIETTLSGKREFNTVEIAKNNGFKCNLIYVYLDNPIKNMERVDSRTLKKGHFVDNNDIIRRYARSFNNLKLCHEQFNRVYIINNGYNKHKLVLSLENNKVKHVSQKIDAVILENIPLIKEHISIITN